MSVLKPRLLQEIEVAVREFSDGKGDMAASRLSQLLVDAGAPAIKTKSRQRTMPKVPIFIIAEIEKRGLEYSGTVHDAVVWASNQISLRDATAGICKEKLQSKAIMLRNETAEIAEKLALKFDNRPVSHLLRDALCGYLEEKYGIC